MSVTSRSAHTTLFGLELLVSFLAITLASHFRGGLVHLKTVGPISPTASVTIDVTQRYGWRRSYGHNTYCDSSTIASGTIIANVGSILCRVGCFGSLNVGIYCTDYSIVGDWSVGERTQRLSVPYLPSSPVMEASFASGAWIHNLVVGGGSSWEVRVRLNVNATLEKRTENASPETKTAPIVNLLYGCNHTITIPVDDADGDDVRMG